MEADETQPANEATIAPEEPPSRDVSVNAERSGSEPVLLTQYLVQEIARAAYFRAQNRGFVPGHEKQDWLEAESNVLHTGSMLKNDR